MYWNFFIVLLVVVVKGALAFDCTQIPSTSIFADNAVHLPGPSDQLQIIPANFNCLYKISVPANTTYGLFANVYIHNGIRGVNDYIRVVDMVGEVNVLNNKTRPLMNTYHVTPGAEMTVQVVTRSVYMQSMFEISAYYKSVQIGPTFPMKTGGEMNYIDVTSLRDGKSLFNSVTFIGEEPIYFSVASDTSGYPECYDCYVIDGTIENQTQIYDFTVVGEQPFTTKSNAITILSSFDKFTGVVLNPKSEADKLFPLFSIAVDNSAGMKNFKPGYPAAFQVVNFETNGIIMDRFETESQNCTAYVVSGPPNNSSKVLLDLSISPTKPHSFDVKYFSVVAMDCDLLFYASGYRN